MKIFLSHTHRCAHNWNMSLIYSAYTQAVSHFGVSVRAVSVCLSSSRSGLNVCPDWIGEGVGIEQYHTHTQTPRASVSLSHFFGPVRTAPSPWKVALLRGRLVHRGFKSRKSAPEWKAKLNLLHMVHWGSFLLTTTHSFFVLGEITIGTNRLTQTKLVSALLFLCNVMRIIDLCRRGCLSIFIYLPASSLWVCTAIK